MEFALTAGFYASRKVCDLQAYDGWETALALYLLAGSWSAGQDNDGIIPASVIQRLGFEPGAGKLLVEAELWSRIDVGYEFQDWRRAG